MNKVSCPVCDFKAREDDYIHFTITGAGVTREIVCHMKIKAFPFCPVCFFTPKETGEYEYFQARLDIEDFKKIKTSGFNPSPDYGDDGSTMATDSWGGAGPDCITMLGEAQLR